MSKIMKHTDEQDFHVQDLQKKYVTQSCLRLAIHWYNFGGKTQLAGRGPAAFFSLELNNSTTKLTISYDSN